MMEYGNMRVMTCRKSVSIRGNTSGIRSAIANAASTARANSKPKPDERVVLAQQQAVMRPAQFVTQRVTNRECMEKQPHVAEIGFVEPAAKLRA